MAKQEKDALFVIAAAYDTVDAAVADYEAVKALYREVKSSHDFDAAVIAKEADGKVKIVKKRATPAAACRAATSRSSARRWTQARPG